MAAYTKRVTTLAPENCRRAKTDSGTIGCVLRRSATRKATPATTASDGGQRGQAGEPCGGRLDQGVDRAGQGEREADGAGHVDAAGRALVAGLGHVADGDGDAGRRQREVDEEHQPPRHGVDEPAADERTERGDDPAQARPRPDGSGPVAGPERRRDHGQAPGHQQGRRRALQQAGDDQEVGRRRRRAQRRRRGEPDQADDEHPPAAVEVAERTAEDEQGAEGQQVGRQDPLELREAGAEVGRDRGQGRVDDRRIEEGHAGAEHGGGEDPATLGRPQSDGGADDRRGRERRRCARRYRPSAGRGPARVRRSAAEAAEPLVDDDACRPASPVVKTASPSPVSQIFTVSASPGSTGDENRPSMCLKRGGSEPHSVWSSARPVKPYVHSPWRIGRSKPPIAANDGSEWSGLRSPDSR